MPITQSAKKALRGSLRKKAVNDRKKKVLKETFKSIERLVKEKKGGDMIKEIASAYSAIDKAAKTGVIKKNTAARKKSRIARMTNSK